MKVDSIDRFSKWVNFIKDNISFVLTVSGIIAYIAINQFTIKDRLVRIEEVQASSPNAGVLELRLNTIDKKLDTKADQSQVEDMRENMEKIDANVQKALDLLIDHLSKENNN
jgi:hypothetical protein